MNEIILFITAFLLPLLYYRSLFYLFPHYFRLSQLRKKTKLQIHHLHYGIIIVFISCLLLLFGGKNNYIIFFIGLGFGQIFDLFITSLLMKGNRKVELEIYQKAFTPTVILFILIVVVLVLLYLFI